jgi:hypothetical protein
MAMLVAEENVETFDLKVVLVSPAVKVTQVAKAM